MAGAASYPEGTTALVFDSEQRSLVKIVSLLNAGGGGGGGTPIGASYHIVGSGTPATDVPPAGYNTAFNDIGQEWFKTSSGWELVLGGP